MLSHKLSPGPQNYIASVTRVVSGDDSYEMKIPSILLSFWDIEIDI